MDAAAWKQKGNEAFSAKNFPEAIEAFSKAIEQDQNNHVLYSNRSASYASLNQYEEAKVDAEKCVAINPSWAKGYARLGAALHGLEEFEEAVKVYQKGLEIEPSNDSLKSGLVSLKKDMEGSFDAGNHMAKLFGPGSLDRARKHPKLAAYCQQADYCNIMTMIEQNPQLVNSFMQDQRILMTMLAFSGVDTDAFKGAGAGAAAPSRPSPQAEEAPREAPRPAPKPTPKPAAAATSNQSPALQKKEEGNALYKQRKFDEALAKYQEAFDLEPKNTTFLLNQTAVYFEQGAFEVCHKKCEEAMEHGKENGADYTVIAKLMTRQASCLQKLGQFDEAIALFNKSLLEHRNAETLTKLEACKVEKKKKEEEAYYSEELSLEAKNKGNDFFKADNFPEAVKCYDEAIKRNPKDHTCYSNRAAALLKLRAYEDVVRDCDKCLAIKPDFVKAITRKGHAYFWTKQYNKALQQYEEALRIDPEFAEATEWKQRTTGKIHEMATGEGDEEAAARAMQDPEIQSILQDSYMQLVLSEMQKDPKKINDYLRDKDISAKLNKLIMAGVLRVGNGPAPAQQGGRGGAGRR